MQRVKHVVDGRSPSSLVARMVGVRSRRVQGRVRVGAHRGRARTSPEIQHACATGRVPSTVTRDVHGDLPARGQKRVANPARHPIDVRGSRHSPCVERLDEKRTADRWGSAIRAHFPRAVCPDRGNRRGSHDLDGTLSSPECVCGTMKAIGRKSGVTLNERHRCVPHEMAAIGTIGGRSIRSGPSCGASTSSDHGAGDVIY